MLALGFSIDLTPSPFHSHILAPLPEIFPVEFVASLRLSGTEVIRVECTCLRWELRNVRGWCGKSDTSRGVPIVGTVAAGKRSRPDTRPAVFGAFRFNSQQTMLFELWEKVGWLGMRELPQTDSCRKKPCLLTPPPPKTALRESSAGQEYISLVVLESRRWASAGRRSAFFTCGEAT